MPHKIFKLTSGFLAAVLILSMLNNPCFAAGDPSHCFVTVKQVLLKKISGEWIPIPDAQKEVDLLEDDPIFSFINFKQRVPKGKYVNFKVILSETVKVSGNDGKNLTRTAGEITVGGTASKAFDLPGNIKSLKAASPTWTKDEKEHGLITEHLNLDYEDSNDTMEVYPRRDFNKPFIIKEGSSVQIWLSINLTGTVIFMFPNALHRGVPTENVMYFIPPKDIDDMSINIGASTSFAPGDTIAFDF